VQLVKSALVSLCNVVETGIKKWEADGCDAESPPYISCFAGGSEKGTKLAKEHLQLTFEAWDLASIKIDAVRKHLKDFIMPILDSVTATSGHDGVTWGPLKASEVDKKGNERKKAGCWFYCLAYTHKEIDMDWGFVRRTSVGPEGAAALSTHCLNDIWSECVALYSKIAVEGRGESGKKAYKLLAAIVQGRSHAAMEIITKTNAPMVLLKFNEAHGIQYLMLDPITNIIIMLSTGAYGLGTDFISSQYGGVIDPTRFGSFMHIARNGLLAVCRTFLCYIIHGQPSDDKLLQLMSTSRSTLLPPLQQLARMSLDELKTLETNGMEVPRRLKLVSDDNEHPDWPAVVIVDLAAGLEGRYVNDSQSSLVVGQMLKAKDANVNPQILPAFNMGGDKDGDYIAAQLYSIINIANARGILKVSEPDIYSIYTAGTMKLARIKCGTKKFPDVYSRVKYLLNAHLNAATSPPILCYSVAYGTSIEDLNSQFDHHRDLNTDCLFLHVLPVDYRRKNVGMGGQPEVAAAAVGAMANGGKAKGKKATAAAGSINLDDDVGFEDGLSPLRGGRASQTTQRAPTPTATAVPPTPSQFIVETHYYIVGFWPSQSGHIFSGLTDSITDMEGDLSMWTAVANASTIDETANILIQRNPQQYFMHGSTILANKSQQLAMKISKSLEPKRTLADFTRPPLDLSESVLLCGESGAGKTCYAEAHGKRPYIIKTMDMCKFIPADCDLLIFDDIRFDKGPYELDVESMKHLLTRNRKETIHGRHFDGSIPPLPRIFLSNLPDGETPFPVSENPEDNYAIARRFKVASYVRRGDLY
jgi:hypothetical protein